MSDGMGVCLHIYIRWVLSSMLSLEALATGFVFFRGQIGKDQCCRLQSRLVVTELEPPLHLNRIGWCVLKCKLHTFRVIAHRILLTRLSDFPLN